MVIGNLWLNLEASKVNLYYGYTTFADDGKGAVMEESEVLSLGGHQDEHRSFDPPYCSIN